MEMNDTIKKANDELEYLEGDEAFKRRVELMEKYERDMNSAKYYGRELGIAEGIKKGEEKKNIEIAKKMLNKKIDLDTIMEITGLSKEEIEKLK